MLCQFKKLVSMRGNALPLCSICCEMLGKYGGPITLPCGKPLASCVWRLRTHCFTTVSLAWTTGLPSHLAALLCLRKRMGTNPAAAHVCWLLHCRSPQAVRWLLLSAGHNGCLQCMASARHSKQECPLCRAPFPKEVQLVRALLDNHEASYFIHRSPAQVYHESSAMGAAACRQHESAC